MRVLLVLVIACGKDSEAPAAPPPKAAPVTTPSAAEAFAKTFAVDLVGPIAPIAPAPGDYAMGLMLRFATFPTMEMHISEYRTGAWRMSLAADGSVTACLGSRRQETINGQYHYQPPEKREHRETDVPRLVALGGTWKVTDGIATIVLDRQGWRSCGAETVHVDRPFATLRCIGLAPPNNVNEKRLACEAEKGNNLFDLGLPMSTALRVPNETPMHQAATGPHVIFGEPGLAIEVTQDERAKLPTFVFKPGAVKLVETDYLPKPPSKADPYTRR
jgi:hypothetical protein